MSNKIINPVVVVDGKLQLSPSWKFPSKGRRSSKSYSLQRNNLPRRTKLKPVPHAWSEAILNVLRSI